MVDTITNAVETMFIDCPSSALHAMSSRAPSAGLSATSTPVAPHYAASTVSVRSPEPDARHRASSIMPQVSAQGIAVPPPSRGALMELVRLQCHSLRCRRRTPSCCRRRTVSLMSSSTVPPAVTAHWHGSTAGARGWPLGFAYDLDTALPHASTVTPSLRSYADVTTAAPHPIGSGRPSSSVEGKDAPLH
jgi:hypothetical protein